MTAKDATLRLAEELKFALQRRRVSQREVERRLGMGKGYLSQLLCGYVDLKVEQLYAILGAAGVAPAEFFATLHPTTLLDEIQAAMQRVGVAAQPATESPTAAEKPSTAKKRGR